MIFRELSKKGIDTFCSPRVVTFSENISIFNYFVCGKKNYDKRIKMMDFPSNEYCHVISIKGASAGDKKSWKNDIVIHVEKVDVEVQYRGLAKYYINDEEKKESMIVASLCTKFSQRTTQGLAWYRNDNISTKSSSTRVCIGRRRNVISIRSYTIIYTFVCAKGKDTSRNMDVERSTHDQIFLHNKS